MNIFPVILSGGSGTRLWPLSRAAMPKQFLALTSSLTMFQETVRRVAGIPGMMAPTVVCADEHRFLVAEQLREIDSKPSTIILEPAPRNTAPAAAAAARFIADLDKDALLLVLPADHVIEDGAAFERVVTAAALALKHGQLGTFGIVPTRAETGYGYIKQGENEAGCPLHNVQDFVEKPDMATATEMVASGQFFWNSGIFLFRAEDYLQELRRFAPAMAEMAELSVRLSDRDINFCRLDDSSFSACPSDSIDYAVMEKTSAAVVIPADIGWSDVGSWDALWAVQQRDSHGNAQRGDVYLDGVTNSLVRAESKIVALIGVSDLVVIETQDAVLVAKRGDAQRVKQVVEHLKTSQRTEHMHHTKVFRPWGCYEGIDAGDRFQVKRITVNPGGKLSLQMHHHRAEHWVVVSGTARVTCGDQVKLLTENESTYIPIGATHRLENPGKLPLHLIEVQSGSYLGEDDIVRHEDIYQRA